MLTMATQSFILDLVGWQRSKLLAESFVSRKQARLMGVVEDGLPEHDGHGPVRRLTGKTIVDALFATKPFVSREVIKNVRPAQTLSFLSKVGGDG